MSSADSPAEDAGNGLPGGRNLHAASYLGFPRGAGRPRGINHVPDLRPCKDFVSNAFFVLLLDSVWTQLLSLTFIECAHPPFRHPHP